MDNTRNCNKQIRRCMLAIVLITTINMTYSAESHAEEYGVFEHIAWLSSEGMTNGVMQGGAPASAMQRYREIAGDLSSYVLASLEVKSEADLSLSQGLSRYLAMVYPNVELLTSPASGYSLLFRNTQEQATVDLGDDLTLWASSVPQYAKDSGRDPLADTTSINCTDNGNCTAGACTESNDCTSHIECTTVNCTEQNLCTSQAECTTGTGGKCTLGTNCTDGTSCTGEDKENNSCTAGTACTSGGACTEGTGCTGEDASAGCTQGGACTKGTNCTEGDNCTQNDNCTNGDKCTDGNACTDSNNCTHGTNCTIGSMCTGGDNCTGGNNCTEGLDCTGSFNCTKGTNCTDSAECTAGIACTEGTDCTDGFYCTYGSCTDLSTCTQSTMCTSDPGGDNCTNGYHCTDGSWCPPTSGASTVTNRIYTYISFGTQKALIAISAICGLCLTMCIAGGGRRLTL